MSDVPSPPRARGERIGAAFQTVAVTTGFLAGLLQLGLLANFVMTLVATVFMAADGVSGFQFKLLWLLPILTMIGAFLALRSPTLGGLLMLGTAAGYALELPFALAGAFSAVPGAMGLIAGSLLSCLLYTSDAADE